MITTLKPNYTVELVKEGKARYYRVGDQHLPGVTSILSVINKPFLVPWSRKVALEQARQELLSYGSDPVILEPDMVNKIIDGARKRPDHVRDDAANFGTRIHAYADRVIKGEPLGDVDKDLENAVLGFRDWFKDSGIKIVSGDTKVASLKHGYGGSFDALGVIDGQYVVIDLKSSNGCWPEYCLQVAAYAEATWETYSIRPEKGLILRLGKTSPDYEAKWLKSLPPAFAGFLAAKMLKQTMDQELYAG